MAADRDEIGVSPFADLKPPARREQRQRLLSHAEIKLPWRVCDDEGFPWGAMRKVMPLTGARDESVFTTTDGHRPVSGFSKTATRIRNAFDTAAKKAGVQLEADFRWHDLRRTVRSESARLGVWIAMGPRRRQAS